VVLTQYQDGQRNREADGQKCYGSIMLCYSVLCKRTIKAGSLLLRCSKKPRVTNLFT